MILTMKKVKTPVTKINIDTHFIMKFRLYTYFTKTNICRVLIEIIVMDVGNSNL